LRPSRIERGDFEAELAIEHNDAGVRDAGVTVEKIEMSMTVPEYCSKPIVVLGCGNVLLGDDGFGPAVAQCLQSRADLPEAVCVIDAGTGVREILFNIVLSERRPRKIIVVDAVDKGVMPGEVFRLPIDAVPVKKLDDFSVHQLPTSNLLKELGDFCGVDVELIACQVKDIPEVVSPGLSRPVRRAVAKAVKAIMAEVESETKALRMGFREAVRALAWKQEDRGQINGRRENSNGKDNNR